jgi:hypothetical protein
MTFSSKASPAQRQKAVKEMVASLSKDRHPILLGPWRSELGFETSYWLPFLTWLSKQVPEFDQRACVVTRGGLAPLYSAVAARGYDLYALRSVTDVRRENLFDQKQTVLLKQVRETEWDKAVLADAADALGLGVLYHVVHPAWMYWALTPYWDETQGLAYLASMTDYAPLAKMGGEGLPPKYVAMKWYGRPTFPYPDPIVAEFVQHTVATVAAQVPVVLLNVEGDYDDHVEIPVVGKNVRTLGADLAPEVNLLQQAVVLSNAAAFIGTYGGVAQTALRFGVPSVSFYTQWGGTAHAHLSLQSWLGKTQGVPFLMSSVEDTRIWRQVTQVVVPQAVAA